MGRWLLLAAALGVAIGQYVMPPWKGFNVVSYDTKSWTSTANSGAFDRLGDTGSNLAMIVASVFVSSPGSTSVVSDPALGSPSDSDFTVSAARAKAKGLMVGVKLRLEFSDRTTYRGLVGRDFASAADWATFFASYAAQVNRFASLAQSVGATVFCIGDQLGLTETQDSNWLSIISGVRSRFSGAVYYSMLPASSSVNPPSWMSSLDFLGASTAFSFAQLFTQLDAASMSNAWWSWNQAFARWYSSFGKKVLVDDLTFVPTSYAATYPNVPKMTGWPSLADWQQPLLGYQRELFYGSLMALNNQAYLQAIIVSQWSMSGPKRCAESYEMNGKFAVAVIAQYFTGDGQTYGGWLGTTPASAYNAAGTMNILASGSTTWADWSWGGVTTASVSAQLFAGISSVNTQVTVPQWAGWTLRSGSPVSLAGYTALEFDIIVTTVFGTASGNLRIFACPDDNCATEYPNLSVVDFVYSAVPVSACFIPPYPGMQESANPLPPDYMYTTTSVVIPLRDLTGSSSLAAAALARLTITNWDPAAVTFAIDRVRLTGSAALPSAGPAPSSVPPAPSPNPAAPSPSSNPWVMPSPSSNPWVPPSPSSNPWVPPSPSSSQSSIPWVAPSQSSTQSPAPVIAAAKQKGFVMTAWTANGYNSIGMTSTFKQMRRVGITHVQFVVTWFLENLADTNIQRDAQRTPTDASVLAAMAKAKAEGLQVIFKPHVDCKDGSWRAYIGQQYYSESQWQAWFSSYTSFITYYASLSNQVGAWGFNMGTELDHTQQRESNWRSVVAAVRGIYPGPVWYGANWDAAMQSSHNWWDALDYLGIDAYNPLSGSGVRSYVSSWQGMYSQFAAWQAKWNKKVLFAEVGYASFDQAASQPWACCSGKPNLQIQADLFQAFFSSAWVQPWMAGAYWWAWDASSTGGRCSTGFDVAAKASTLQALANGYGGYLPAPGSAPSSGYASPYTIYANGATSWQQWSWSSKIWLQGGSSSAYPGNSNSISFQIYANGALSFYNPTPVALSQYSALELDIQIWDSSYSTALLIWLCEDDSCNTVTPRLPLVDYTPTSSGSVCSLPTYWASSGHIQIPLSDFYGGASPSSVNAQVRRFVLGAIGDSTIYGYVDNIRFTSPTSWSVTATSSASRTASSSVTVSASVNLATSLSPTLAGSVLTAKDSACAMRRAVAMAADVDISDVSVASMVTGDSALTFDADAAVNTYDCVPATERRRLAQPVASPSSIPSVVPARSAQPAPSGPPSQPSGASGTGNSSVYVSSTALTFAIDVSSKLPSGSQAGAPSSSAAKAALVSLVSGLSSSLGQGGDWLDQLVVTVSATTGAAVAVGPGAVALQLSGSQATLDAVNSAWTGPIEPDAPAAPASSPLSSAAIGGIAAGAAVIAAVIAGVAIGAARRRSARNAANAAAVAEPVVIALTPIKRDSVNPLGSTAGRARHLATPSNAPHRGTERQDAALIAQSVRTKSSSK